MMINNYSTPTSTPKKVRPSRVPRTPLAPARLGTPINLPDAYYHPLSSPYASPSGASTSFTTPGSGMRSPCVRIASAATDMTDYAMPARRRLDETTFIHARPFDFDALPWIHALDVPSSHPRDIADLSQLAPSIPLPRPFLPPEDPTTTSPVSFACETPSYDVPHVSPQSAAPEPPLSPLAERRIAPARRHRVHARMRSVYARLAAPLPERTLEHGLRSLPHLRHSPTPRPAQRRTVPAARPRRRIYPPSSPTPLPSKFSSSLFADDNDDADDDDVEMSDEMLDELCLFKDPFCPSSPSAQRASPSPRAASPLACTPSPLARVSSQGPSLPRVRTSSPSICASSPRLDEPASPLAPAFLFPAPTQERPRTPQPLPSHPTSPSVHLLMPFAHPFTPSAHLSTPAPSAHTSRAVTPSAGTSDALTPHTPRPSSNSAAAHRFSTASVVFRNLMPVWEY
ncbi:hypothetical protein FISHEDRAFT_71278 [Fistulina hepatica ATCC 64428]|nr:hypothetical protein FISHEDRAFT_71278 [Fistulina hepatica ATCC 64428]